MQGPSFWTQLQPTVVEILQYLLPVLATAICAKLGHGMVVSRRLAREQSEPPPSAEPFDLSPSARVDKSTDTQRSGKPVSRG